MKFNLKSLAKIGRAKIVKNGPTISALLGIGLMGFAGVKAVEKTPVVMAKLDEKKKELGVEKLTVAETVKVAGPYYAPSIILFTAGSGAVLGGQYVATRRATMATAAYSMLETRFKEYVDATKEVVGEKKESEIRDQVAKTIVEKNPPEIKEPIITGNGKRICLDVLSQTYFWNDKDTIINVCKELNSRFRYGDKYDPEYFIPLEDYYYGVDIREGPYIELAKDMGWHREDGEITPHFTWINGTGQYQDMPILAVGFMTNPIHRKDDWR